jgi:hypothetical protein
MSHIRNKSKKTKSYKKQSSSHDKKNSKELFKNIKKLNIDQCMNQDFQKVKELALSKNIVYNSQTSQFDLCTQITKHQRKIFVGNKVAPFLKQQIFSTSSLFKNSIHSSVKKTENSDCSLCKV